MSLYYKKCVCEYDGTAYAGWQCQRNGQSIQEAIERALEKLYNGERVPIIGSGRTDAGVHALGQVFSYRSVLFRDNYKVVAALNSLLPRDIGILSCEDAPEGFHAQFDAKSKTYKYLILNRATRAVIERDRAWFRHNDIDVNLLSTLFKEIVGTYDFTSFCSAAGAKDNMTRTLNFACAQKEEEFIVIRVNADGFLHNMVRIIVGTAVTLAIKGGSAEDMRRVLEAKNRTCTGITAPPQGLYLEKVYY